MPTCQRCGEENPAGARFCSACGAPLGIGAGARGEERKVVTVLFVDLVGFTARSDEADPEDVRARLRPYHARLKQEIERFGGTVEKFIGDAVMAVFGAPVAHEDDPERAVRRRAARSRGHRRAERDAPGLELSVRDRRSTPARWSWRSARGPSEGEGMVAGDVVNTASRLQRPPGRAASLVGETTYRATRELFEYEPPSRSTSRERPSRCRSGERSRPRAPLRRRRRAPRTTPFVGRDARARAAERDVRADAARALAQLVTMVGEPGVGKSRLVRSSARTSTTEPELVIWRQGRCLPYGEGITFWALGEIVKAQAGILESDPPDEAARKLAARSTSAAARRARGGVAQAASRRSSAARRRRRPSTGDESSPPGGASSRPGRASGRSCWSSRTCTGPTTRCWSSSSTWSSGRRACRCSSSARPGPSCSSGVPAGAAASGTR